MSGLSAEDRAFYESVVDLVFKNPFLSESRSAQDPHPLISRSDEAQARLSESTAQQLCDYASSDRKLMQYVFLFLSYQELMPKFDDLIDRQQKTKDSIRVDFAQQALDGMHRRGFETEAALEYFALFFQMRRAYFSIAKRLVGATDSMRALRAALWNNVVTHDVRLYSEHLKTRMEDFSTMLLGETGTGKGSAAHAIGQSCYIPFDPQGSRFVESFTGGFVQTNLSQFSAHLIESELFGHQKGAFTGATHDHEGVLSRCSPHGALFLDEIGDVDTTIQLKLLQVLEQRTFHPVGSHAPCRFSGRVIAATHQPLDALRQTGQFREDFFYRLCSDVIVVPTLRQRLEEDPAEVHRLTHQVVHRLVGKEDGTLNDRVCDALDVHVPKNYAWPGNVRELEQAVRRILLSGQYSGAAEKPPPRAEFIERFERGALTADELLTQYLSRLYNETGSYEEVGRRVDLDRRTVKKYIDRK